SPKEKYLNLIVGTNSRLDAIQAAILRVKLKYLSKWSKERAERANYYSKNLNGVGDIITPFTAGDRTHIFHQYTLRIGSGQVRDKLKKYLGEAGIPTMIYYPLPLHLQSAFKNLVYKEGDFPEAEKAAKEVLSLPIYPEISQEIQKLVIEGIKNSKIYL
ncbi:MAG TPA: DegT/DnrJ/EryC1/StrS family aminotransferase, partial [Candidatus Lokiarchaeia archaeon]